MKPLSINLDRVQKHFEEIGRFNSGANGYTRLAFSEEEIQVKKWLTEQLARLNIPYHIDGAKNVIARFGSKDGPCLAIGSHLDTVKEGGLYDGALGVLAGLEVIETFIENGVEPHVPIELICFTGEEANPLGGTFGSRAMAGFIQPTPSYEELLKQWGFSPHELLQAKRKKEDFRAFLELHIEQGEVLEKNEEEIGIVTSIAGMIRLQVKIKGRASHSGTTPMHLRKDALLDAANLITKINRIVKKYGDKMVATVGEISIFPNMANVVPGEAELLVEIRGSEIQDMHAVRDEIYKWIQRNISDSEITLIVEKEPNNMAEEMQLVIKEACLSRDYSYRFMLSGANHDANAMTALTRVGMIFVPSLQGISHHPEEYTSWEEIERGIYTLLETVGILIDNKKGDILSCLNSEKSKLYL